MSAGVEYCRFLEEYNNNNDGLTVSVSYKGIHLKYVRIHCFLFTKKMRHFETLFLWIDFVFY
jgi:hypothetical protein